MANESLSFPSDYVDDGGVTVVIYAYYFERQLLAALLSIAACVGFIGNIFVILAVFLSKKLRTSTNVFVVNLSVADLLTCLSLPWQSVSVLSEEGWPLPEAYWLCVLSASLLILCSGCSVNNLALIALSRWVGITKSRHAGHWMRSARRLTLMVALAWLIPCSCIIPPLISDFGEVGYEEIYGFCSWDTHNKYAAYFNLLLMVVFYPLQFCTIIFCYSSIFNYVRSNNKKMAGTVQTLSAKVDGANVKLRRQLMKRQLDVTKNLLYIVLAFSMSQTPYFVLLLVYTDLSYRITPYVAVVLFTNCCMNPIIYATSHPNFKEAFDYIVRGKWKELSESHVSTRRTGATSSDKKSTGKDSRI
ncbi:melanopsin-A-like [Asterias rubens]|uniref:melanopsin-A-like n=1 Tax=Asterias rubens TaxID=7604 RepID=UPI001455DB2F|nr:melanopsin-A-like [Asterias rubens]